MALDDIVHVLRLDARTLRDLIEIFPDIQRDLYELAKEREIARIKIDPWFQMQLFDHKQKIESIIEQLKGQDENSSFISNSEEVKESHQLHDIQADNRNDENLDLKY